MNETILTTSGAGVGGLCGNLLRVTAFAAIMTVLGTAALPLASQAQETLSFEALEIEGQAQKPLVAFILPRSGKINLDVDIQRFKPAFSKKNLDLVRKHANLFEIKE